MNRPQEIQWVPLGFAFLAAVVCIVAYVYPGAESARQGAFNIALTLAGTAGGAYAHSASAKPQFPTPDTTATTSKEG